MTQMVSETPHLPPYGGMLHFNGNGVAACPWCNWRGVATIVGGRRVGPVRFEPVIGSYGSKLEDTTFSPACPVCSDDTEEILEEIVAEGTRVVRVKIGRNAPCDCNSGKKAKKCCYR